MRVATYAQPMTPPITLLPRYEIRAKRHGAGDAELEVWQMPSPATPNVTAPLRLGGLRGRNLELVEHRLWRRLKAASVRLDILPVEGLGSSVDEDTALKLALMFRALAPMRNTELMRLVADGVEAMGREEASYWLGMTIHRRNPRRVLSALRILMTDPQRR